mmetsp:Transcript_73793/g.203695  ORF Transcript_73793/g.203695 Transcript_73793/m.203695 type:complete len:208 (-) Transcript_73793:1520-2143(-)
MLAANFLSVSKPSCLREPLASSAIIKSCCAMQISSPSQACVLHVFVSKRSMDVSVGHFPLPRIGTSTFLFRVVTPPSQAMEHGAQSDHSLKAQSRSQDSVLQFRSSVSVSHTLPPYFGFTNMDRVLPSMPPSHSLVHLDQPPQLDITHSTAHFFCPHFLLRSIGGHSMPYWFGDTTISRFITSKPPHRYGSSRGHVSSHKISIPESE